MPAVRYVPSLSIEDLPDGAEVAGPKGGEIKRAKVNGRLILPLSSWGVSSYDGLRDIWKAAKSYGLDAKQPTAAACLREYLRATVSSRLLVASPPLIRAHTSMAVHPGPMVVARTGHYEGASIYDMREAYLTGLTRALPIPRTQVLMRDRLGERIVRKHLDNQREGVGFIICALVSVGDSTAKAIGPLPTLAPYTTSKLVNTKKYSIRGRVHEKEKYVTVTTYVKQWPEGTFWGVWTDSMLINAMVNHGVKVQAIAWSIKSNMEDYLVPLYDFIASIDYKPLRKALYTRLWGGFVESRWSEGIVYTDGITGTKEVRKVKKAIDPNQEHMGRFWAPEKAAYIISPCCNTMVNTILSIPTDSFLMSHVDSIHTTAKIKDNRFKHECVGKADIRGQGSYKYRDLMTNEVIKKGDMDKVSEKMILSLDDRDHVSRMWVTKDISYPHQLFQGDKDNLFNVNKLKYSLIHNGKNKLSGGWLLEGPKGRRKD